jgi:hypothetical protein
MLLSIAESVHDQLTELKQRHAGHTLQLIFFDGEEAFKDWYVRLLSYCLKCARM